MSEFKIQKYGRLTALEIVGSNSKWQKLVRCVCDCGYEGVFRFDHVKSGRSKSCGCLNREATAKSNTKHGDCRRTAARAAEFCVWSAMKERCRNPNTASYARYGGRGIKVCEAWTKSYSTFLNDVGRRPSSAHSLERIDNDGDYRPGNVRWATKMEQCNNRSTNHLISFGGRVKTLAEWSRVTGLNYGALFRRILSGWDIETALTTPLR